MSELIENLSDLVGRKSERLIIISDFFFVFSKQAVGKHKVFFLYIITLSFLFCKFFSYLASENVMISFTLFSIKVCLASCKVLPVV